MTNGQEFTPPTAPLDENFASETAHNQHLVEFDKLFFVSADGIMELLCTTGGTITKFPHFSFPAATFVPSDC